MRSRLPLVAVAVVIILCLVGVSIAAVAAGGHALAYKVNGSEGSQSTIDGQLDDLAHSEATKQVSKTSGSVDSRATAQVLTLNIIHDVLTDAAARKGVEVTDADRTAAGSSVGASIKGYPASYRDLTVEIQATANALGLTDSNKLNAFLVKEFRRADVYVNPRYGRWSPRLGVCPPTGCATSSGATSGGATAGG